MALLGEQGRKRVADAIQQVERQTNAELVTVLAAASDDYRYIPLLWAALIALAVPTVLFFTPIETGWLFTAQLGVFVLLAVGLQFGAMRIRLIPKSVASWRASNMARRQFLELGLHHTKGDTGILVFVSEAEHYVEILVDRGISEQVEHEQWVAIVDRFIVDVRAGKIEDGFIRALEACGQILSRTVAKTPDNHNELDDRLVVIGYDT